jgi:hypothetical protein
MKGEGSGRSEYQCPQASASDPGVSDGPEEIDQTGGKTGRSIGERGHQDVLDKKDWVEDLDDPVYNTNDTYRKRARFHFARPSALCVP